MEEPQFISDVSTINPKLTAWVLNKCVEAQFKKQETLFKLWIILQIDLDWLGNELFFYGIDIGYINKNEARKRNGTIYLHHTNKFPINLPEIEERMDIEQKYKENNWELFRLLRRCKQYSPCTRYIYRDDAEQLTRDVQNHTEDPARMLDEAAYFGSIQCFKYLMINGTVPTEKTIEMACHSGNEEILQLLKER